MEKCSENHWLYCVYFVDYLGSSPMNNSNDSGPETSNDKALQTLEKQLTIETKVKNGTENMIQSILQNYQSRDKKLLAEAHNMLADSKAKIEFLKLKILKVKQNRQLNKVSERENCSSFCCFVRFFMKLFSFTMVMMEKLILWWLY